MVSSDVEGDDSADADAVCREGALIAGTCGREVGWLESCSMVSIVPGRGGSATGRELCSATGGGVT